VTNSVIGIASFQRYREDQLMKPRKYVLQLVVAALFVVAGCNASVASVAPIGYPADVRANFLQACSSESPLATCECMLDELEANVSFSDFAALEAAGTDAVLKDDRVMAAVLACVN
jgi:hypothetical protein